MNLSETKIDQLLKNPQHKRELQASELHHRRLAFHSDIVLRKEHASKYYSSFTHWIGELLPEDKKDRIETLLTFPLCTNELMKDIFMGLERVWYAKDYTEEYTFATDEYKQDFKDYLKQIRSEHLWKVEGWSSLKTCIDAVVIIDLPSIQQTFRPEPYFYFIAPYEILDFSVNEKNSVEYIIFKHDNTDGVTELIVYDDTYMRKYAYTDNTKGTKIAEIEHGLEYCPARMFWGDKLQDDNYINKRSPITDSMGDLDWLLFFKTSKKYLDLHAPYPIYITYEIEEEGPPEKRTNGTPCDGDGRSKSHKGKSFMGPGSFSTVPPPGPGEQDMMNNPVQVVGAEIEACEYSSKEVDRLANDIYRSCVGSDGELMRNEAVNEKQVEASFKSREEVLLNIARNLSEIMLWTNETMARLRYGIFFIEGFISFGEDFYLQNESDLMTRYADAKQKGVNQIMLNSLDDQIYDVAFKNRKRDRKRIAIMKDLDPMPGMSISECAGLLGKGVSLENLTIKVNLLKFVRRFELEQDIDILEYEPENYLKKINEIILKFKEYAREQGQELPT